MRPIKKKKNTKPLVVIAVVAICAAAVFFLIPSSSESDKAVMPPSANTLNEFYNAITSGRFEDAEKLCVETVMSDYINGIQKKWSREDTTITSMTADILSGVKVTVTNTEGNEQTSTIYYSLGLEGKDAQEKIATLKNEEGEWKIESITDKV